MRAGPLTLALGATTGAGIGLAIGPFLLGWGLVAALGVACALFAFGLSRDPGDAPLRTALLALAALDLSFLAASVPLTWSALERLDPRFALDLLEPLAVRSVAEARPLLVTRWAALGALGLVALSATWRWGRPRR